MLVMKVHFSLAETYCRNSFCAVRLARLVVDKVLTAPCETSVLYPRSGGNLHCFTAVTPCAVLDVLAPPYREDRSINWRV